MVVSTIEHESVLKSAEAMCMKHGFHLHILSADGEGHINPAELQEVLHTKNVGLVSIMYVNNEIGSMQHDMRKISNLCHNNGAFLLFRRGGCDVRLCSLTSSYPPENGIRLCGDRSEATLR